MFTALILVALLLPASAPSFADADTGDWSTEDWMQQSPEDLELSKRWSRDMWLYLTQNKIAHIRAMAAYQLTVTGDALTKAMGRHVLSMISREQELDAQTLWYLVTICNVKPGIEWCAKNDFAIQLIESDPENAAVYLVQDSFRTEKIIEDEPDYLLFREALLPAARASRFDMYFGRGSLQLFRAVQDYVDQNPAEGYPNSSQPALLHAYAGVISMIMIQPFMAFQGTAKICEYVVENEPAAYVAACLAIAKIMQEKSMSLMARSVGYGLERKMVEHLTGDLEMSLYLFRKSRISSRAGFCQLPAWQRPAARWLGFDEVTLVQYFSDLDKHGEIIAQRNAGLRDYEINPDSYDKNPAECQKMMELDSDAMGAVLGKSDPKLHERYSSGLR